jgi:hypothetical protein
LKWSPLWTEQPGGLQGQWKLQLQPKERPTSQMVKRQFWPQRGSQWCFAIFEGQRRW